VIACGAMRRALAVVVLLGLLAGPRPGQASLWPSAEGRVERELSDADVNVRRGAALELASLPRSAGRKLALTALADADAEVRIAALRVAASTSDDDLGGRLAPWLSDPDPRVRLAAAEALAVRPSSLALASLGRASSDADARVRVAVARALGGSGNPEAVVPLLGRLDDAVPDVRREVVTALGRLGDRRAVVPLLGKVQDSAGAVRRAAARALGLLGDGRAGSALLLVLRDSDPEVRVAALDAVGRLRDSAAVASIVAELAGTEPSVRAAAARALGLLATPAALSALLAELGRADAEPEPIVRALVLAGPAALPAVRSSLEGKATPGLVEGAARALAELGDPSDGARVEKALERGALGPLVALPVLAKLGGPSAVPTALEALGSPDAAVRHSAAFALAELMDPAHPDGRAVDPLLAALRSRGATLAERALLVRLLGRTGSSRVGAELTRVARDATPPSLVASALLALGDLGRGPWESALLDKLDDDDGSVRSAAGLALRRSASESAFAELVRRLDQGAEQDRLAVGLALPGAAAASRDARLAPQLLTLFARARNGERDALLEAWAELGVRWSADLGDLSVGDRRKLAEVLGGHAKGHDALALLASDLDPGVRANAAWSLGQSGSAGDLGVLGRLTRDRDPRVAANAAVALGRLGLRLGGPTITVLCPLLADARASVRQNAVAGLALLGGACENGSIERLLTSDPAARVRRAAARALASEPRTRERAAALERCAADDPSAEVAELCSGRGPSRPEGTEPVLVFVVPTGGTAPVSDAPFALRFADGTERFGSADRRGAVFERSAPRGAISLGVLPFSGE
jgi:HEAT repeat protein